MILPYTTFAKNSKSIAEYHGSSASGLSGQDFTQVNNYDRWGNRTIDQGQTSASIPHPNYTADPNTNQLVAPIGYSYSYDNAGNLTNDTYTGQGSRTYDAENRMTQAQGLPSSQWQTYTYDADGRRIKRKVNGVETWQIYGLEGELLAEYQSGASAFLPVTEYGYRGGQLLTVISSGDTQRLNRFVTNLYYGALRRDPTATELQDSVNQLAAAGAEGQSALFTTAGQIGRSLFIETNYETTAPARTDLQHVGDLYYVFLQRGPDTGGLNWWVTQLQPPNSRANVCNDFAVSPEFQALVATLYGTAQSDNERTDHFVNNFYLGAYGRDATATELQQQRDALNAAAAQGQAQVQAQAEVMGRALFAGQINERLSDTQFVTNLYEGFLQRGPDAAGLTYWTQASVGQGRQNVLDNFATCGPFRELAGSLYREANWLVADHLGTPRMVVNKSGALAGVKRHDYLPFGEELGLISGRSTTQGYTIDSVRQKFTDKERDSETGLHYFGARYYSEIQGRFTSVDPLMASAHPPFPQSWNRYSYVLNKPLRLVDPTGMSWAIRHYNDGGDEMVQFLWYTGELTQEQISQGYTPYNQRWYFAGDGAVFLGDRPGDYRFIHKSVFDEEGLGSPGYAVLYHADPSNLNDFQKDVILRAFYWTTTDSNKAVRQFFETLFYSIAFGRLATDPSASRRRLGDLTAAETEQIQAVVDEAGRPLEVVGSAASGTRRGVGTNLPIGKGPGTRSDIDYLLPPSSQGHYRGLQLRLPSLDPQYGLIPGTHNPWIGPGIRFEPNAQPCMLPKTP